MRYKLEAVDPEWRQVPGGSSTLTVCFYDESGNRFGLHNFVVKGSSTGWKANIDTTAFLNRRETIIVPQGAKSVDVIISSAGSPTSVGVYLVKNVAISRKASSGTEELVFDGQAAIPGNDKPIKAPLWITDGTRAPMAQILPRRTAEGNERVLAIIDTDTNGHAEWRIAQETASQAIPGEPLTVTWQEAYETTIGDVKSVVYDRPPTGQHEFVMQEIDSWGNPLGQEVSTTFTVQPPYWQQPLFWGGAAAFANLAVFLGFYGVIRLRARRIQKRNLILEQERFRIAQDLHDDLGARLTHLSLLSYNATNRVSAPDDQERFREFSLVTRDLVTALSETIWTVNPKNDHLESLVGFLCRMITIQCKVSNMRCRIDALALPDHRKVQSDMRHHIVLAVKETLNNVIKHSGSEELYASIGFDAPILHITITDRGRGFVPDEIDELSNGIRNMQLRMSAVSGKVSIQSNPGDGTTVKYEIPIPKRS